MLSWTDTTRVETQDVTASLSGSSVDTLTVTTAFSAIPPAESIWVLTETAGGQTVSGSAKEYKVLAISQGSKNEFSITAVEHYDEKFSAVDEDFTTYIADSVYPAVRHNDVVPPVTDVYATSMMNPEKIGEELTIQWTPPLAVGTAVNATTGAEEETLGNYEHIAGYEITHNFPEIESPITIKSSNQTSYVIEGVTDGTYQIAVKVVNILQNVSKALVTEVRVSDKYKENIPRMPEGVPYTGTTSVGFGIQSDAFTFRRYAYTAKSPSGISKSITNTSTSSAAWQQSCTNLPIISWSESNRAAEGEFIREHAYILLDASDSTDRLKLLKYHRPAFSNGFWYDAGSGNNTNKYGSALTGTFSKAVGTTKVTGSGTAFLTQIKDGDNLKLGSTEGYKVAAVVSDTLLYVTNNFSSFSGVQGFVPNIRIDYANDFIIARVYNTSSGLVLAESYAKIDAVLKPAGDIVEEGGVSTAEIAENAVTVEEIDTSAATGGTFGAAVAALDAASFSSIDTDVLDANSVIAREVQVFPVGGTAPTISGTTLTGAGIDLKQDGDMYVGNYSDDKYMFWDQSEGTMTFRGTLNVDDITGSSATFGTLMAEVATIGTLNTKMLDSDAIVTRDIRVGPSAEITAGSFVVGTEYYITDLGNTTQAQWNSVAGTSSVVYNLGSIFTAANTGTGTGKARNRTTVAKIANTTLTGSGAHLNAAGDFYVGNAAANKYMFWDQSAGTMTLRGELNADDISAGNITAANINVTNLEAISANLGDISAGTLRGGTVPEATSAPTGTEAGAFLDLGVGKMVLGNASKYIWWDGTNLTINGVTISNASLANSSGFATETYVDNEITALVGGAPGALDTLNELAAAVNDDSSFASSVTTSLGTKVAKTSNQALSSAANALTISGNTITLARGDSTTDTVTVPDNNTQYSAGSGISLSGTTFSNSAPDQTVALTGSGSTTVSGTYPNFTISSSNTNTQRSDEEIRDVAASIITAGTNVSVVKNDAANTVTISSTDTNTVYTHPAYTPRSINTSGATVLDTFTSDSIGSVTGIGTRTLTLANLGYTGATDANRITDNSQIANGRNFTTNTGTTTASNTQTFTNKSGDISQWTNDAAYVTSSGNTIIGTDSDINTSGALVIDQLNMTDGVIQSHSTRTLTLANLGYTGATDANKYVLPFTDNSSNWNTAYGWGDHGDAGYLTSQTSHADVVVDGDFTSNGILKRTSAGNYGIVTDNSNNWNTAYGWGDHGDEGYQLASADAANATQLGGYAASLYVKNTDFASASTGGVIKLGYNDNGKNYAVELSSNKAYVNVPWENTVYTHPASTARNINTSGAQVIDIFTSNAIGSVTNVTTRTMTLADLGLTNNSSNWNTAYNNHITGVGVSGTTTKTITLTQQDGGTLTTTWADLNGSNDYVDSLAFNTSNGILTVGRTGSLSDLTVDLDGRFVTSSGNTVIGTDSDISATGSTVISAINMTDGVIQSHSTRTLTLGDLGFSAYSHPNHSGDVTSSGDGATTIANDAVTFAKMQDIATDTFMGRTASGSGDAKALSVSEARTMLNVENGATADQTASEILTLLKTVDSNTSGLNAATLDSQEGTYYLDYDNFSNKPSIPQGDITNVTVTAPITGGGTSGSVGIGITQASASANGYLSSTDWTTFNNKSTFDGDYSSLSGEPTIPSGNQIIDWTTDQGVTNIHAGNYLNTNTTDFNVTVHSGTAESFSAGNTLNFTGGGSTTVSRSGKTVDISSTNTDRYVNSASFATSTGVLTLTRAGSDSATVTVDLDGRYATSSGVTSVSGTAPISSSGGTTPAISVAANSASSAGVVAAGSGNNNKVWQTNGSGVPAWRDVAASGVTSLSAVGSSGISVVDGSTGTPEIGTTGNLNTLATASSIPSLSVDFLEAGTINADHIAADTIVASHIDADAITSEQLQISADSGNDRIQMDGTNNVIKIFSGGVLRVKIGNLA